MIQKFNEQRMTTTILGNSGNGKSYFLKKQILDQKYGRIIIIDTMDEYETFWSKCCFMPTTHKKCKKCGNIGELFTGIEVTQKLSDIQKKLEENKTFKISFRLYQYRDIEKTFRLLCKLCYEYGNVTIIFEEVQKYIPKMKQLYPEFHDILFRGRHKKINKIFTTQQIRLLNTTILEESQQIICFKIHEKNSLKALEHYERSKYLPYLEKYKNIDIRIDDDLSEEMKYQILTSRYFTENKVTG